MTRSVGAAGLERIELQRLTERIGRLFSILQEAAEEQQPVVAGTWRPPVDVCETARAICVRIELPGVTAAQIRVGLTSDKLRVCGEKKKRSSRHSTVSHLCSERIYGKFDRVVSLPWTIATKNATAELSDGVLVIWLPKTTDRRGSEFRVPITDKGAGKRSKD
jgi:HSP20 family protein